MDSRKLRNSNNKFRVMERLKREILGETISMILLRYPLEEIILTDSIIISTTKTYIPRDMWNTLMLKTMEDREKYPEESEVRFRIRMEELMLDNIFFNFDGEYTYEGDFATIFSENKSRESILKEKVIKPIHKRKSMGMMEEAYMMILPTRFDYYLNSMCSSSPRQKSTIMRFYPLMTEKYLLMTSINNNSMVTTPIGLLDNHSKVDEQISKTYLVQVSLDRMVDIYYSRNRQFKENNLKVDLDEDYMTMITKRLDGSLTQEKVDYFNRMRHELFMQVVLREMGETNLGKSDIDMMSEFNYFGPKSEQTPDYVIYKEDRIILLDFAVTISNPSTIRDKKLTKYEELRRNLQEHTSKEVEVEAVVWKINSFKNFFVPPVINVSENQIWSSNVIRDLSKLFEDLSKRDDFYKYAKSLMEEKDDIDFEILMKEMQEELQQCTMSKLACHKFEFSSRQLEDSRMKLTFEERISRPMKNFKDTSYYNRVLDKSNKLGKSYIDHVENEYLDMIKEGSLPVYQEKFTEDTQSDLSKTIEEEFKKSKATRLKYQSRESLNPKIPSILPFPLIKMVEDNMEEITSGHSYHSYEQVDFTLSDGTMLINSDLDYPAQREEELRRKNNDVYSEEGLGLNMEEDSRVVNDLINWSMEISRELGPVFLEDNSLNKLFESNLWSLVSFYGDLAENLCYMEGRRLVNPFSDSLEKDKRTTTSNYSVIKNFKNYQLILKRGSKMTKEKQIRFKVRAPTNSLVTNNSYHFKKMLPMAQDPRMSESKWLTISGPMLKHYLKVREVTVSLYSSYQDKVIESNRGKIMPETEMDKTFVTMIISLLESKRGTSTTMQLNRYLFHSSTSYISSRVDLAKTIMEDPIRTRFEAYIRGMQLKWFEMMCQNKEKFWNERLVNMGSTDTDHDRFWSISPFDLEKSIEFSIMMDCIYTCNLFEKDTGFTDHRVKAITSKMVKAERSFLKKMEEDWSKGHIPDLKKFWNSKDELHYFDENFVISTTKRFFESKVSKFELTLIMDEAMGETIEASMMMTSSLISGPFFSSCLDHTKEVGKTKTFLSLFDKVSTLSTSNLMEMVSKYTDVEAIFALFPKAQIGGPREILIQSVRLRIMVKFMETISRKLCQLDEKEMLTKDHLKAQVQSDTLNTYRQELIENCLNGIPSLTASFNMDASKWAPGFVMEQFFVSALNWPIPEEIKNLILSVISAFSCKIMFTPNSLKEKWDKKSLFQEESRDDLEWFRKKSMAQNGAVEIMSGMGQGMFQFTSSFMACLSDYTVDIIAESVVSKVCNVNIKSRSLLSSDDKTKFLLFTLDPNKDGTVKDLKASMKLYSRVVDSITRLFNIHINWKKSGLNFIISEFNSLFSIGKRMVWASIKDIYNANSIPDLSNPEDATQFMLSSIRRCLEHGVYMTTIKRICGMARNQMRRYYRLDEELTKKLCLKLDTTEEYLPYHLGYFPLNNIYTVLTMGKEVLMFSSKNSDKLKEFYKKLYSAQRNKMDEKMKNMTPFTEDSRGRFWMEVNMRMDKELRKMKEEFFSESLNSSSSEILKEMDNNSMNINLMGNDMKHFKMFTSEYFVGMKRNYEFNELMPIHSLIRALQLSRKAASLMPKTKFILEREEELTSLKKVSKSYLRKDKEMLAKTMDRMRSLEATLKEFKVGVEEFVDEVMMRGNISKSVLNMYSSVEGLCDYEDEVMEELKGYPTTTKHYHGSLKNIRFYISPVGMATEPNEIIKYIFENNNNPSNRVVMTVQRMMDSINLDRGLLKITDIFRSPFQTIRRIMKGSNYPLKDFKDFMSLNFKEMRFKSMNMISDFSCSGNFKDNLKKMMMTRMHPGFSYRPPSGSYSTDMEQTKFLSSISLAQMVHYPPMPEDKNIKMQDSKILRGAKYWKNTSNRSIDMSEMRSERVEYTKFWNKRMKYKTHFWSNLQVVAIAKEFDDKVELALFSEEDLDMMEKVDRNIFYLIEKFKHDMESENKKVVSVTFLNYSLKMNISYNKTKFLMKTKIQRGIDRWRMILWLTPLSDSSFFDKNTDDYIFFTIVEDNYTVEYTDLMKFRMKIDSEDEEFEEVNFKNLMMDPPDLEQLDKILVNNDLIPEFNMPISSSREDSGKFYDVKNFLDQLNKSTGASNALSSMSRMFRGPNKYTDAMKDLEDLDSDLDYSSDSESRAFKSSDFKMKVGGNEEDLVNDGFLSGLRKMMANIRREEGEKIFDSEEDRNPQENVKRVALSDLITEVIRKSLDTCMEYDRKKMKNEYYAFKTSGNEIGFHNLLLWQINMVFDFSISDTMAIWVYNYLLTKISVIMSIHPTNLLVKYGPDKDPNRPKERFFIRRKEEISEAVEKDIMSF